MNRLEDKRLYKSETVKNILFDGFDDKILDLIKAANYSIQMPFDRFAWFASVSFYHFICFDSFSVLLKNTHNVY